MEHWEGACHRFFRPVLGEDLPRRDAAFLGRFRGFFFRSQVQDFIGIAKARAGHDPRARFRRSWADDTLIPRRSET
jgi:hypothetical protein